MKVAQLENEGEKLIGLWLAGKWINLSEAMKLYHEAVEHEEGISIQTLDRLFREEKFDPDRLKRISDFVSSRKLSAYLKVSRDSRFNSPLLRPGKIVALGRNYVLHAKEARLPVPKEPIIFEKASSSVAGPYDNIEIPRACGRIDHEAELAVIIGKRAKRVTKKDAFQYVAGYTILQDITARDLQNADLAMNNPWFRSKSFDSFTPMGPCLVLADEIRPPVHLNIECRVNGRIRQKANTRDMVFDIPTTIEFITKHITLEPGDVISTGTPEGIGEITDGDEVVTRIEKIGEMRNKVRFDNR